MFIVKTGTFLTDWQQVEKWLNKRKRTTQSISNQRTEPAAYCNYSNVK